MKAIKNYPFFGVFLAIMSFVFSPIALAEKVQIKYQGMTLNGDLILAENKTLKDGVVLFLHGTWIVVVQ